MGADAYPLQGIVRVQALQWVVNRSAIISSFVKSLGTAIVVGFCLVGGIGSQSSALGVFGTIGVVAIIGFLIRQLQRRLNRPPVYGLTIQTAAGPQTLVYSENRTQVQHIVSKIIDAIDNPTMVMAPVSIDNRVMQIGRDYVDVKGSHNAVGRFA